MRWPIAAVGLLTLAACKVKDPPPVTEEWKDTFERGDIGGDYYISGKGYDLIGGQLSARGAHNHPLWLRKKLPHDVRIELDCWSNEERGDVKVELFGDGKSFDPDAGRYMATGYEVIFGGWFNSKSIIARLDEHGKDMVENTQLKVQPTRHYHWTIERVGKKLTWLIDQQPFLVYDDPNPLEGPGHEYFGFNNWESDTWFDNLVITPL
ncbi:MAG TPA: hypothetical protein VL326_01775 [Kofleriaceae bacterium]|jgi:hypothetical protein|nr:hypothetical protein [Kofleriaceae bacterium]